MDSKKKEINTVTPLPAYYKTAGSELNEVNSKIKNIFVGQKNTHFRMTPEETMQETKQKKETQKK